MAVTGFWPVFKNLKATLDYADNPDKTTAPEYLDEDLYAALRYAENDDKTDRKMFAGGINCSAQNAVYEGCKTEDGVHLEYYMSSNDWDNELSCFVESRDIIRSVDGDENLYREVCALFGNCRIDEWAGFRGANPPDVLDGSSMSFSAVLADGTEIEASGSNNFPKNYQTLRAGINRLITSNKIRSTEFSEGSYAISLPKSWVGVVSAGFSEGMVAFSVDKTDGDELTFFIIDTGNGYSSDSYKGRVEVGRLVSDENTLFVTARDHYRINAYPEKVSDAALALWETYESDKRAIIESLHGINGYELYPEDGSILHETDARDLADKARSLWLTLNFAGEYSAGEKPVTIRFRKYIPMFPQYRYVTTMEEVRKNFLEVFSEELTDKILSQAVADRDLIEHNDNIYVAYKKNDGEVSYNSWMHHVEDDGNGNFTVVMAVRKRSVDDIIYVKLPTGKNAEGKFVFTDYPYWDKSK